MPDDKTNRGEPDRSRISLTQEHEVRYWTDRFGVTRDHLVDAIAKVGNSPDAVRRYLGR
jgi:hypothetical protein